ncbi:hypothetical protein V5799_008459 [Amblyomma americanum]|uniref:Uncharacterized protein n=1 Tax=Amblyomma americanum TaxID=6943 RepID=A0AAQ4FDZ7_AMBAM
MGASQARPRNLGEATGRANLTDRRLPRDLAETSAVSLANLRGARGPVSGKVIDLSLPCTASQYRTCQIVDHLALLNEFLFNAGFELREIPETRGQLSLSSL